MRQRFEREERTLHCVWPVRLPVEAADPAPPGGQRAGERLFRVDRVGNWSRRTGMLQDIVGALPATQHEASPEHVAVAPEPRTAQNYKVGPDFAREAADAGAAQGGEPRRYFAIAEAQREGGFDLYRTLADVETADHRGYIVFPERHEVRETQHSAAGAELGLKHLGIAAIGARHLRPFGRAEAPGAVALVPQ